jgi:Kef-type K+ transport system membrane component KefB
MLALTCASVDDVLAWCLLAFIISLIHAQGALAAVYTFGLTICFICGMLFVVRPLLSSIVQRIQSETVLLALSIILLLLAAYITNGIGIHPVFGAFLAGIILPRNVIFTTQVRNIDQVNNLLLLPLFFVYSGLQTRIGLINGLSLWLICLLVFFLACLGKILGSTLSARFTGETWQTALSIGILMNTRGLVELIVLNIGLQLKVLSPTLFAMLVIMAVLTTMMASPLLPLLGFTSSKVLHARETAIEPTIP